MLRKDELYNYLKNVGEEKSLTYVAQRLGYSIRTIQDVAVSDPRVKLINYYARDGRVIFIRKLGDIRITLK